MDTFYEICIWNYLLIFIVNFFQYLLNNREFAKLQKDIKENMIFVSIG